MNDSTLLMTGVVVFSLMLAAIVLTVIEFNQIGKRRKAAKANSKESRGDK